ncbi:cupin domain-containing protein [Spirillospora sp. CA-294931]|uniref:cupin domain-containing protein n=1 Tax=Spirillospora sp. CA-294931 TaxID=3240042 RepID=UPI003D934E68
MTVIRSAERRRTETPNAVMTTLASPTQGGAATAVWHVDMKPGRVGPFHAFDAETVWTFLGGQATIALDGRTFDVAAGDTVVMPADAPRRLTAADDGFTALVTAPAGAKVYNPDEITPEDACAMAPKDAERLIPLWTR